MTTEKNAGSPTGESIYLAIGFIRRPHGVMGELILDLHTDFPERFKTGRQIYLGDRHQPATLSSVRPHANGLLVKIKGYETPESAGKFRNHWVYVKSNEVPPLPKGQFYKYELVGLTVIDDANHTLGKIAEVLETGANDVYVVRNTEKEILLPAIPDVILKINMEERIVTVHLIDGLI
jgi:16S rRNA processing protein RimM